MSGRGVQRTVRLPGPGRNLANNLRNLIILAHRAGARPGERPRQSSTFPRASANLVTAAAAGGRRRGRRRRSRERKRASKTVQPSLRSQQIQLLLIVRTFLLIQPRGTQQGNQKRNKVKEVDTRYTHPNSGPARGGQAAMSSGEKEANR